MDHGLKKMVVYMMQNHPNCTAVQLEKQMFFGLSRPSSIKGIVAVPTLGRSRECTFKWDIVDWLTRMFSRSKMNFDFGRPRVVGSAVLVFWSQGLDELGLQSVVMREDTVLA